MKLKEINYERIWAKAVDDQDEVVRKLPRSQEPYDAYTCRLAFGPYKLQCFCYRLTARLATPWLELTPLEAGRLYLINKHHWHPRDVKELNLADLLQLLHEELADMKLTEEEWLPVHGWTQHMGCYSALVQSAPEL